MEAASEAEALYKILCCSYSPDPAERRHAEASLLAADRSPAFLAALLRVAAEPRAQAEVRIAAAIQFKNQVRRWWAPVGDKYGQGYADDHKAAVRRELLAAVRGAAGTPAVRAQLVEAFREIAATDFPQAWPGLVDQLLDAVRSGCAAQTFCGLLLLRRLFKQLEARPTSRRAELESLAAATLPALLTVGRLLLSPAAQSGGSASEAVIVLRVVLKCVYSAMLMAVSRQLQQDIDAWMQLLMAVVAFCARVPGDGANFEASPEAKCRKWVFHIFFRFCCRHGNPRRCVNGAELFAQAWSATYAVPVTEVCLREACDSGDGPTRRVSRRTVALALLCLGEQCSKEATYAVLRPGLQQLLERGIFPWVRFGAQDMLLWNEDPEEFARRAHDDLASNREPRAAAVEFIERLQRHRHDDVLMPLLRFCKQHLDAQALSFADLELCANKDGALLILGTVIEDLVRLDPAQAGSSKLRKKQSEVASRGASALSIEDLLRNYVRNDLESPVAFLRLRACWLYEQVAGKAARLGPTGTVGDILRAVVQLIADPELPVRTRACGCLGAFVQRERDDEVRVAIAGSLGPLMERLLQCMAEMQSEETAGVLEALVRRFPQEITPFAAQLIHQLAMQISQIIASAAGEGNDAAGDACGDDDDDNGAGGAAIGALDAVLSVLHACAVVGELGEVAEDGRRQRELMFAGLVEPLAPLLARLLQADCADFLEESCEVLRLLTQFGPSPIPAALWSLLPLLHQAVCGSGAATYAAQPELCDAWAPDAMRDMFGPLQNYASRGPPVVLVADIGAEGGRRPLDLIFEIAAVGLRLTGAGSEADCAAAALIGAAVFENAPVPLVDDWLPRHFDELWRRLRTAETVRLQRAVLAAFAAMAWYNAGLLIRCAEERRALPRLVEAWLDRTAFLTRLRDRRRLVLGFTQILQVCCLCADAPVSLSGVLPRIAKQLASQTKELANLRLKRDAEGSPQNGCENAGDSDSDDVAIARPSRGLGEGGEDFDDGSADDSDEDDFAGRGGDIRSEGALSQAQVALPSRLELVDELSVLRQVLQQASPAAQEQLGAMVGAPLAAWIAELVAAEEGRRHSATSARLR